MRTSYFKLLMLSLLVVVMCSSCSVAEETTGAESYVVEGWIDSGRFPIVKITRTMSLKSGGQSVDSLANYIEKWARVAVCDGERTVVLTGTPDKTSFPPYTYTTGDMRGEVGKTYTLTVDVSGGHHIEAITTIPEPVRLDSFSVKNIDREGNCWQLCGYTNDRRKCKFFTQVLGDDNTYESAYLGLYDDNMIGDNGCVQIYRGGSNLKNKTTPYFSDKETVLVKFSAIDSVAFSFWRSFEDMVSLSRNPLFPVTKNLKGNVNGALGYWFGYGSTFYVVNMNYLIMMEKRRQR